MILKTRFENSKEMVENISSFTVEKDLSIKCKSKVDEEKIKARLLKRSTGDKND